MRTVWCLLLMVLTAGLSQAQPGPATATSLQGRVLDSASRQPLPQATVSLLRSVTDSARISLQLTDGQGRFALSNLAKGNYWLVVSYVGYGSLRQPVTVATARPVLDVGTLALRPQPVRLREVVVQRRVPVRVKHDTLEFDAGAFVTRPNAVVEDLLRQLPGMDVAGDGTLRAQGQGVQQVLVNGKPFFGNDSKMATRNLPADLIDKVQIFDQRSEQSVFSGVDDGSRSRTINIVTKPEARRGQFGQQATGYGTDGRYVVGGGINRFNGQRQVSVLGQTNNLNQIGYSLPAYSSTAGQAGGITRSVGAGLNYTDHWGKRTEVAASYLLGNAITELVQRLHRQTVLPNLANQPGSDSARSSLVTNTDNRTTMGVLNHGVNGRLSYQLDSINVVRWNPGYSAYLNNNASNLTTQTLSNPATRLNRSLIQNNATGTNQSWTNTLLWMHRFRRAGRTLSVNLNTALNQSVSTGTNRSQNTDYVPANQPGSLPAVQDQRTDQRTHSTINELTISYTEPVNAHQTLEWRYNLYTNRSASGRTVFDVGSTAGAVEHPNAALSNGYQSSFVAHRLGAGWQVRQPRYQYTLGLDVQPASLRSAYSTGTDPIHRRYVNLLPSAVVQPQLGANQYLQVQYQTRVMAPSVTQLQPVADVTNPLLVQRGNPDLRPEYTHALTVNYNRFQTTTYRTVFALLMVGLTNHRIVTATRTDAAGVQTIRPVNANGYLTAGSMVTFGRPVWLGSLTPTLNLTTNLNVVRGVSYVNDQPNRSLTLLANQNARLSLTVARSVEINVAGTVTYQTAAYSLQRPAQNPALMSLLTTGLSGPLPMGLRVVTDFTYTATAGRSGGYNQTYALWNGYVSRSLGSQQQGELRLQVVDLLNQNRSLVRTVTDTSVEDSESRVLRRYVLFSLLYNLRQFGDGQNR